MKKKFTLQCPIRGVLKTSKKSKDGLTPTEEYFRVEAIKHLIKIGYPKENFKIEPIVKKFGSEGKNSFRSDFAILNIPSSSISTSNPDELLEHTILLCEVKRDNKKADYVKKTQVSPMLDFAKLEKCIGLYWDNVEQRVFWQETENGKRIIKEGPLSFLPLYGSDIKTKPLTFNDTTPSDSLVEMFGRIEDVLHQASIDPQKRFEIILQLLLAKIFDEHYYEKQPEKPLGIQDFYSLEVNSNIAKQRFESILKKALSYYERYLPNRVPGKISIDSDTLIEVLRIIAPVRIIHSKRHVIQTFYMKFAKELYKWDMAQYFTPPPVTDFIVELLNPQFGEHVCDPACGSADFLVAAFHIGREFDTNYSDCVWGVDKSANAVQIAILNMLLNGDGKANIRKSDSLKESFRKRNKYQILICNPPFGTKIVEKRKTVLEKYDLGHVWEKDDKYSKTKRLLDSQETGILFFEICVKECEPGGRIGIILPNGYLGNRSHKYRVFREYLFRYTKLVSICSFPRFTFKYSGADVSASLVVVEKREKAVENFSKDDYFFSVEMIENVGWEAGTKKASPIYKRNPEDGSYILDFDGKLIIDSDFSKIINRIRGSMAEGCFEWVGKNQLEKEEGWSLHISNIINDYDLTMDPKRYCEKITLLKEDLKKNDYVTLGEIVDFIPERQSYNGEEIRKKTSKKYRYTQILDMGYGDYHSNELYGWELPSRAKHFAETGDIYFGSVWGSVTKWCYIGEEHGNLVVTNGCHRCRIKKGKKDRLLDLLTYINTEGWSVQLRSLARGSDGLAEVCVDDAKTVLIPVIKDKKIRDNIKPYIENLKAGNISIKSAVMDMISQDIWDVHDPKKRPSHIVLV